MIDAFAELLGQFKADGFDAGHSQWTVNIGTPLECMLRAIADLLQRAEGTGVDLRVEAKSADTKDIGPVGQHLSHLSQGGRLDDRDSTLNVGGGRVCCQRGSCIPAGRGNAMRLVTGHHVRNGGRPKAVFE